MKNLKLLLLFFGLLFISAITCSQEKQTLAEQLGYPRDAKLLIVHMDDMGMSHSVNMACMAAFEKNNKFSGSIMVPCPWFLEIAEFAKTHPQFDIGVHLTLTSEWKYYKWRSIMSSDEIPTLLNKEGYFYATNREVAQNDRPEEAEKELRAQVERAIAFGIKPTHIDIHMGSTGGTPELTQVYRKVSEEYSSPNVPMSGGFMLSDIKNDTEAKVPLNEKYKKFIEGMKPGLNKMIVHLAFDNEEMQAVTTWDLPMDNTKNVYKNFGASWRQKDFDYITGNEFKNLLEKNDIHLVTWKEIQNCLKLTSGNK